MPPSTLFAPVPEYIVNHYLKVCASGVSNNMHPLSWGAQMEKINFVNLPFLLIGLPVRCFSSNFAEFTAKFIGKIVRIPI